MSILPISTVSGIIHNTSFSSTSTSILEKPLLVSVVTVTDKTTVTETSCSDSSTLINSFESASLIPTSLIADNVVNSKTSMKPSVPTTPWFLQATLLL
jgi:hypothetical protein